MDELRADDRALVLRMLAGDERAFDAFFDDSFPRLYRFALVRLHGDGDAAEEVAQRALSRAVTKLGTWRGEAALFTWLCTFCRHEISAWYERQRRAPAQLDLLEDRADIEAALASLRGAPPGPEETVARAEVARLVQVTLDALPPHYSRALEWKYVEGLSVKEIAERLLTGPKAVESVLTRAREAFRDAFATLAAGSPAPAAAQSKGWKA